MSSSPERKTIEWFFYRLGKWHESNIVEINFVLLAVIFALLIGGIGAESATIGRIIAAVALFLIFLEGVAIWWVGVYEKKHKTKGEKPDE